MWKIFKNIFEGDLNLAVKRQTSHAYDIQDTGAIQMLYLSFPDVYRNCL